MKQGVAFRQISPELCNSRGNIDPWYFEFRLPDAYDIHSIYLDYDLVMSWDNGSYNNVNPIKVSKQATNPTVDRGKNTTIPIIATMIYTNVTTKYPLKEVGGVDDIEWCTFNGDGAINFNWVDRTIEFPKSYKFIQHGRKYYAIDESNMIDGYKLRISDDRDGIQWLLFNRHTKQIRTLHYLIEPIDWDQSWLMVATFWINKNVQSISPYKINGKMFGIETTSGQGGMSYDAMDSRLILPDKMYFVKGEDLPIYMTSVIPEPKTIQSIKPSIMYKTDSISTDIDKFSDGYNLSSDKLKNGFRIGYTNYMDDYLYYKDIESEYCDPSSVGFKNPVILHIGDSITNRDIAYRSSLFLNKWGITPTYVGTMNNGNKRGEGREGWTYTNFIGMSSIWNNNGSVINPDDSSETTDLNSNPFLKIATYSDKINNPDICFAHDGVRTEISYSSASESDKSKTFYIFDIANYLSAHNVAKPDIITIALSTNDINSSNEYLNQCLFSMNTMIDRVREQLPDVKIGIIPSPAWGYGHNNFKNKTVKWIEECITSINSRNDPNVFIIPIWCHMNREWGFNINNITISNSNNSMYGWLSDSIHPNENGQQQYAKALSMCICNMLK